MISWSSSTFLRLQTSSVLLFQVQMRHEIGSTKVVLSDRCMKFIRYVQTGLPGCVFHRLTGTWSKNTKTASCAVLGLNARLETRERRGFCLICGEMNNQYDQYVLVFLQIHLEGMTDVANHLFEAATISRLINWQKINLQRFW